MKNLRLHIVFLLLLAIGAVNTTLQAQDAPPYVTPESLNLYQHGRNAGGIDLDENIDSVTIGSTTKYFFFPDSNLNAGVHYNALFTGVISAFDWAVTPALATGEEDDITGYATAPHYKQVTWTGLGLGSIQVIETAHASQGGCTGSAINTPIRVIAAPTVTGITIGNISCTTTPVSVACPNATLTISCVVNGLRGVSVVWSLDGPTGFTDLINQTSNLGNSTTIVLSGNTLNQVGAYTLTINSITDRISSKCGFPLNPGISRTFYVTPQPVTSPNFHVPNQGW